MAASMRAAAPAPLLDTQVSRLVFVTGFVVFLLIALVSQVLAMPWRSWLPGAEGEGSLIGGVRSAVYTFMSNIP